jgi:hypothetical protein
MKRYKVKRLWRIFLCKLFGHDWNYCALIGWDGEFYPACNRCGVEKI